MMLRDLSANIPGAVGFTYGEFVKSDTATRLGIENNPSEDEWKHIELLARKVLQPIRDYFGPLKITSGFRCLELNRAIKSGDNSNHRFGFASDIEPVDTSIKLFSILEYISKNLKYCELIAEYFPNGWVHVAYKDNVYTNVIKLKDKDHNYTQVSLDYIRNLYG